MVPIPKGRWENLSLSDIFRAITFNSILCKLLIVIVMTKETDNWCKSLYHIMLIMSVWFIA